MFSKRKDISCIAIKSVSKRIFKHSSKVKMKKIIIIITLLIPRIALAQGLSIDSCKALALENNKQIIQAKLKLQAAEQVKKEAFTNYFPKVSAQGFVMRVSDYMIKEEIPEMNLPVYDGNPVNLLQPTQFAYFPGMQIETYDYTNLAAITAIQPVFSGGRIINGNKLAKIGVEVSEDILENQKEEVLLKTENYYWKIVTLQEKQKTLDAYLRLLENLNKDVNAAYKAGIVQKSDLLKVQLKLNDVEVKKYQLKNGLEILKMAFCQHLGIEYTDGFQLSDSLSINETPESVYVNHQQALYNRNEYSMLQKSLEAEKLRKKMIIGENLPQISIGAQALYLDAFDRQDSYGIAFATVSIPISGWWGASHKISEHKIKEEIAQTELNEKSELMILQMEKSYKDLSESYRQIKIVEISLEQAREHLKIVTDNFKAGVVNTSDMLEAQAIFQEQKNKLLEAKSNYKMKVLMYKKSVANF